MYKTGHYRSATQVLGESVSLQIALGSCIDGYPTEGHPIFPYTAELQCAVVSHREQYGRQQLHLAVFEAGAGAAVVETLAQVRVNEVPAPQEKEFIRSQVFLICSNYDAMYSTHNVPLHNGRVNLLVNNLVNSFGGFEQEHKYLLQPALDEARYRDIMNNGISEIDLGIAGFKQTLEHALQGGEIQQSGIVDVIKSLWSRQPTEAERRAAEKISGRFVLRPGRDWSNAEVKSIMTSMAMELLDSEHDEGFAIVTKNGLRITQDAVRLTENFNIDGNSQVVNSGQMFNGLHEAFEKFSGLGIIGDDGMVIEDDQLVTH